MDAPPPIEAAAPAPAVPAPAPGKSEPIKYTINGVDVWFPFKPYPSQVTMMDKVTARRKM